MLYRWGIIYPARIAFAYLLIVLLALLFQPYLIYLHLLRSPFSDLLNPSAYGFTTDSVNLVRLTTSDDLQLVGWHILPRVYTNIGQEYANISPSLPDQVYRQYLTANIESIYLFSRQRWRYWNVSSR
ncbi:MAG: hypothetical protein ACI8QH_001714 [Flammeovirgaceae bacterium]|jgi:hypothetical protein